MMDGEKPAGGKRRPEDIVLANSDDDLLLPFLPFPVSAQPAKLVFHIKSFTPLRNPLLVPEPAPAPVPRPCCILLLSC